VTYDDIKNILVPVDGSKNSYKAIKYASKLSKSAYTSTLLLNVIDTDKQGTNDKEQTFLQKAYAILKEAKNEANKYDIDAKTKTVFGMVPETIVRVAKEENIDLIVMGTRGQSTYTHLMMGHVSEIVAERAHCPVLLVR